MSRERPGLFRIVWRMRKNSTLNVGPYRVARRHLRTMLGRSSMEMAMLSSRSVPLTLAGLGELRASSMVGCVW